MGVLVVRAMSDSSVFLMGVTIVAVVSLVVGYLMFNKFQTKQRARVEWGLRAAVRGMVAQDDLDERKLKARIIQTLTHNTSDLNMLNNSMNHVLLRIGADLQKDGPLNGLLMKRSRSLDKETFDSMLAEYVKNLAQQMNIPLMSASRQPYGSMYGRTRSIIARNPATHVMSARAARRAFPSYAFSTDYGIEMLDENLRRY